MIDVKQNTAYHYEAVSTPNIAKGKTLVDHYASVIVQRAKGLQDLSLILTVDGYFAKKKFVDQIVEHTEMEVICKLRDDANLKYLAGEQKTKGRGRPRKYDRKVDVKKIDKCRFKKEYEDSELRLYSLVVYSVGLKRTIKVSYVEFLTENGSVKCIKIYFSTNLERSGIEIYKYYKARFQMEFIFRDSKQYTGLEHCQARSANKLNFHYNASLSAINIAKIVLRNGVNKNESIPLSIGELKLKLQNRNMLYRIFSIYGIDHKLIKLDKAYQDILDFGTIAA